MEAFFCEQQKFSKKLGHKNPVKKLGTEDLTYIYITYRFLKGHFSQDSFSRLKSRIFRCSNRPT